MARWYFIIWLCCGALGLGLIVAEANRRQIAISPLWYFVAFLLGPAFLFFVLPIMWFSRRR